MKCNWLRWLWGIIPLIILSWVAAHTERFRIEQDLLGRTQAALQEKGQAWATPAFEGRDGVLTGQAADEADPGKALEVVRAMWGVRQVDNQTTLLEKPESYVWVASRRANRIRITGYVPNKPTRQTVAGVIKANFPGFELVDRSKLARGVTSLDTWLTGVSFALKQLSSLKRGNVRLEGLGLSVAGEAEDVAGYRAVKAALANELPKGIKLISDQVTPPVASPFVWEVKWSERKLAVVGHVPTDAIHTELMSAAAAATPGPVDGMEPADGAPQGFAEAARASIRAVTHLQAGHIEIRDAVLTVNGTAANDAEAEGVRAALRGVPQGMKVIDQIHVTPPPPPPPPPKAENAPEPKTENVIVPPLPFPAPLTPPAFPKTEAAAPPAPARTAETAIPALPPPAPLPAMKVDPVPAAPPTPVIAPAPTTPATLACRDELSTAVSASRIQFLRGSAQLMPSAAGILDKVVAAAKACPKVRIEIGGHASIEGIPAMNQRLSMKRAEAVRVYLVHAGVPAERLESVGYGTSRPLVPNTSRENAARNRRIEFTVRPQ